MSFARDARGSNPSIEFEIHRSIDIAPTRRRSIANRGGATIDPRASMKYVVVSGGVVSGLGKGVTASSLGVLLKAAGWRVTSIKIDPYINLDAGTMSPFEHGETYVLDDGGESDLDLGNYERFVDSTLTRDHNITTGKVYQVRERRARARTWVMMAMIFFYLKFQSCWRRRARVWARTRCDAHGY